MRGKVSGNRLHKISGLIMLALLSVCGMGMVSAKADQKTIAIKNFVMPEVGDIIEYRDDVDEDIWHYFMLI